MNARTKQRQPRFEVVQTASGFHARFRASNGAIIASSEVYATRRAARRAVSLIAWSMGATILRDTILPAAPMSPPLEVREVDEREAS